MSAKRQILILGGGFAGVYAALELERRVAKRPDVEVTLISHENFFLFTPMLHEVASSDLDPTHIVNPVRKLLRRVRFFHGRVDGIDLAARRVTVRHGSDGEHGHELDYDHLVLALGSTTHFHGTPGLAERALTMKSLGDAFHLRNRLVQTLEEADSECFEELRPRLLTLVVAGGGFAGVETVAGVHDFWRAAARFYPNLSARDLRVVLVHAGPVLLPELDARLGRYAERKLAARGVEIRTATKVTAVGAEGVRLSDGGTIPAATVVWTAGTAPHPLLAQLPCAKNKGRLVVNQNLEVPEFPGVWALGDAALVPDPERQGFHPPTAQHALRQGRAAARNIAAALDRRPLRPFRFRTLGQLASLGRRTGVAQIFGLRFSGFLAWWLWRTIYLSKLPRWEKRMRVSMDWTLDVLFHKDLVQMPTLRSVAPAPAPPQPVPV